MALTNQAIEEGFSNCKVIGNSMDSAISKVWDVINTLNNNPEFSIFCQKTEIGINVFEKLNKIGTIMAEVNGSVSRLNNVTVTYLNNQRNLNQTGNADVVRYEGAMGDFDVNSL